MHLRLTSLSYAAPSAELFEHTECASLMDSVIDALLAERIQTAFNIPSPEPHISFTEYLLKCLLPDQEPGLVLTTCSPAQQA